jgi:CHRD domain
MPGADELPPDIHALADRHSLELGDGTRWRYDVEQLLRALDRMQLEKASRATDSEPTTVDATIPASSTGPSAATGRAPASAPALEAPPPQAPPQHLAAHESSGRKYALPSSRLLLGILIAGIVAIAAVLASVLLTRGSGSSSSRGRAASGTALGATLSSSAEVPKSISSGSSGTVKVTIDGVKVCWSFQLSGVDNPTQAHIHQGGPTVSGPVVVPLGARFKPSGCTTSTSAVVSAIVAHPGAYYANVHSARYPDGVVRGQLVASKFPSPPPSAAGKTKLTALEVAVVNANKTVVAKGMIPLSSCTDQMLRAGIERVSCPNVWIDVGVVLYQYPNLTAVYSRYHRDLGAFRTINGTRLVANSHHCIGPGATGEAAWRHPPYPVQTTQLDPSMPASMAKRGWEGRVFCGQSSSQLFQFEWTFDPGRLLGIATSLNHDDLWVWWHAIHHNLLLESMNMAMPGPSSSKPMGSMAKPSK